jgi:hypothetical protein
MLSRLFKAMLYPLPLRVVLFRRLLRRFPVGPYYDRLLWEAVDYPWYGFCVYHAAALARRLGIGRISVAELGVAGGNGLLCLEEHARETEKALGIAIEVYGFDREAGLPDAIDYRDLPYVWPAGSFPMDRAKLAARLTRARLILGDVGTTAAQFYGTHKPAPLGAVMFDLDLYSSTAAALAILDSDSENVLPRVFCYFDDIVGYGENLFNDFTGVRLAIREFNQRHLQVGRQLCPANAFRGLQPQYWHQQVHVCHYFKHPSYTTRLSAELHELPLSPKWTRRETLGRR